MVVKGQERPEGLVCLTHNDSLDLLAWIKSVARFQREALQAIEYHERMNNGAGEKK